MTWYIGPDFPELAMKPTTIFYYASDGEAATKLAHKEHVERRNAVTRDATAFDGEAEICTRVVIMPSVSRHHRAQITAVYGPKVEMLPKQVVAPPVAPPAVLSGTVRTTGTAGTPQPRVNVSDQREFSRYGRNPRAEHRR